MSEIAKNEEGKILESLNWLRGIASLLVCLFHFKLFLYKEDSPNFLISFFAKGDFGVIMFFIISGFIIPYSMYVKKYRITSFFRYLAKRSLRIEPPYIAAIFLTFWWTWYSYTHLWGSSFKIDWQQLALNITYLVPFTKSEWINIIFWTLAIEFQFYILTGLIFNLILDNKLVRYLIFISFLGLNFLIPEKFQTVFNFYIYFIIGYQCFVYYVKKIEFTEFIVTIVVSLAFVFFFEREMAVPFALFTVLGIFLLNIKWKFARFMGNISYSLYLTHGLIGGNVIFFAKDLPKELLFFVAVFNAIAFAYVFYLVFERRFLMLSKKLNY